MSESVPAPGMPPKRRIRNYLLNPRFQLKYAGIIVAIVVALMTALGLVIMRTANAAAAEAQSATDQAERAMHESQTSSRIVAMQSEREADSGLVQTIQAQLDAADRVAARNVEAVRQERVRIERNRKVTAYTLFGAAALLVVILGALGIVITHKVVGPVFKMKRLLRQVGTGRLSIHERLRKGDELEDLFEVFLEMVHSLRAHQAKELSRLQKAVDRLAASEGTDAEALSDLRRLAHDMQDAIGDEAVPAG